MSAVLSIHFENQCDPQFMDYVSQNRKVTLMHPDFQSMIKVKKVSAQSNFFMSHFVRLNSGKIQLIALNANRFWKPADSCHFIHHETGGAKAQKCFQSGEQDEHRQNTGRKYRGSGERIGKSGACDKEKTNGLGNSFGESWNRVSLGLEQFQDAFFGQKHHQGPTGSIKNPTQEFYSEKS